MRQLSILIGILTLSGCELSTTRVEFAGLELGPGPQLLLDDYLFENIEGVTRTLNSPARDPRIPNPLVTGIEDGNSTPYFAVLREDSLFRIWYNTPIDNRDSDASHLAYMESPDGIHWIRPHRVLNDPRGGEIRFGASVIHRPGGGYVFGYFQGGGLRVATSSDGLDWIPVSAKELIQHDHDIAGITYDPIRKRYIGIISELRSLFVGGPSRTDFRQTRQSVSTDLLNWEAPWDVLTTDLKDDESTQFYGMDGFLPRGELIVSMVKILRDDLVASGGYKGMGWTTLAWTRDGRTWERDREIFLEPDPELGTWDHTNAWIDEQVMVGDTVYLYYGGYAEGHKGTRAETRQIGLVKMLRDRYVAWEAGEAGGSIRSRILRLNGSRLTFNVEAPSGELDVKVLDADGGAVLSSCTRITGDHLDAPLTCDRSLDQIDEPVRLLIQLRNARLFAFSLVD